MATLKVSYLVISNALREVLMVTGRNASARRAQVLQYITASLQKLAATRNLAVIILTQCATRLQAERATLVSAVNAGAWEQGVSTRLVLFRDWIWKDSQASSIRFVGVQKLDGRTFTTLDNVVAFDIDSVWSPFEPWQVLTEDLGILANTDRRKG